MLKNMSKSHLNYLLHLKLVFEFLSNLFYKSFLEFLLNIFLLDFYQNFFHFLKYLYLPTKKNLFHFQSFLNKK